MKEIFERIHSQNKWGNGSGEGSLPIHTKGYASFLESFLCEKKISTVVDLGCGDWQFSKFINWRGVQYLGYDIVASVISRNQEEYSAPNISFHLHDGNPDDLPGADLLIAKDVLQHWSNHAIERFLPALARYKHALLTNCVDPGGRTLNRDIEDGDFRYLDLRLPPFNLAAQEVYSFTPQQSFETAPMHRPRWLKRVLLVESATAGWTPLQR